MELVLLGRIIVLISRQLQEMQKENHDLLGTTGQLDPQDENLRPRKKGTHGRGSVPV